MAFQLDDTIAALSSAVGPAARGIVRISGPDAKTCVASCFVPTDLSSWNEARTAKAHRGTIRLPAVGTPLPVLVYHWPDCRSVTGGPLVEIHTCGSPPLLNAILATLFEHGARPAGPGEFTLRSFLSGRVDLLQAEAILGVIDAPDDGTLTVALRQLAGGISGLIVSAREDSLDLLADLEAGLDFVEEDIEFVSRADVIRRLGGAMESVDCLLRRCDARMHSAHRKRVVLAGLPNAGKSTLFNALVGRDSALVSSTAGTTRDYLRGETDWHGVAVELIDTPGWENRTDGIMGQARELGQNQWSQADLVLWCTAGDLPPQEVAADEATLALLRNQNTNVFRVRTKSDLLPGSTQADALDVSVLEGRGFDELIAGCVLAFGTRGSDAADSIATTSARCRESLVHARAGLVGAVDAAEGLLGEEVVAMEVRETLEHFGRILGTVYSDDILGRIFSRFCIGK